MLGNLFKSEAQKREDAKRELFAAVDALENKIANLEKETLKAIRELDRFEEQGQENSDEYSITAKSLVDKNNELEIAKANLVELKPSGGWDDAEPLDAILTRINAARIALSSPEATGAKSREKQIEIREKAKALRNKTQLSVYGKPTGTDKVDLDANEVARVREKVRAQNNIKSTKPSVANSKSHTGIEDVMNMIDSDPALKNPNIKE